MQKDVQNSRIYFENLASQCEENGFLVAAALIYRRYDPERARNAYARIAESAHMAGLYRLAAEAYRHAGMEQKSRRIIRHAGLGGFSLQDTESNAFPFRLFLFATTRFEREGNFENAKKYWLNAGRNCETVGEFRLASIYYMKGGDFGSAKHSWRRYMRKELIGVSAPSVFSLML